MQYESIEERRSEIRPGVTFVVARISFGRRLELMRRVRELAPKLEYCEAGNTTGDRIEANLLSAEIDRLYIEWGLREIRGLEIDGAPANPTTLVDAGPEDLCREALQFVKRASGLSESEAKN